MKVTAEFISAEPEALSKEPKLSASKPGGTVDKCLCDRAMNLCHSGNVNIRVPARWAVCDLDALEDDIRKSAFCVAIIAALGDHPSPAYCAFVLGLSAHAVLSKTVINTANSTRKVKTIATRRRRALIPSILYFHCPLLISF